MFIQVKQQSNYFKKKVHRENKYDLKKFKNMIQEQDSY